MAGPLRIDGVDISKYQPHTIDWAKAKDAGVKVVCHKATEGVTITDPFHDRRRAEVTKAGGIRWHAYHFLRPGDGRAQARYFLSVAKPRPGDLWPVLDYEADGLSVGLFEDFLAEIRKAGIPGVILYTYSSKAPSKSFGMPLWIARYSNANTPPQIPAAWQGVGYWMHQFSDGRYGNPNSVPGIGHCDLNHIPDLSRLDNYVIGGAVPTPEPDPLARPSWRGRTNVDALTISCIERAEAMGAHEFIITQGSYQSGHGDVNSSGTHDRGGVVDLRWCGHDKCILNLRKAGMFAWHRTEQQGPWPDHIHAGVLGHPDMAASAERQETAYRAGRNGLANNGADDGPRLNPIPTPIWPWPEEDPMADYAKQLDRIEQKIDADRAEQREFRAEYRKRSVRQRQAVMEKLRGLKKLSTQELAAIEALMPADES